MRKKHLPRWSGYDGIIQEISNSGIMKQFYKARTLYVQSMLFCASVQKYANLIYCRHYLSRGIQLWLLLYKRPHEVSHFHQTISFHTYTIVVI